MSSENRFSGLMGDIGGGKKSADTEPAAKVKKPSQPPAKKTKKAKYEDKENYKQVGLYLPVDVHRKMKIGAAMTGEEMSDIAAEGIRLWLKKHAPNI